MGLVIAAGVEYPGVPDCPNGVPLVGDFSSTFMSRPFAADDYAKFAVVFAGAQKNVGPPGITIVIVQVGRRLCSCVSPTADSSIRTT